MEIHTSDTFEVGQLCRERHGDRLESWPIMNRLASQSALWRLLQANPGVAVAEESATCIDASHPRFPAQEGYQFMLLYSVKLDRPIPAAA